MKIFTVYVNDSHTNRYLISMGKSAIVSETIFSQSLLLHKIPLYSIVSAESLKF